MTEEDLAIKLRLDFNDYDGGNLAIKWEEIARWHLAEIKKAELRASIKWLVWSKDPTEGESVDPYVALEDKIKMLQSELRKLEEDNE